MCRGGSFIGQGGGVGMSGSPGMLASPAAAGPSPAGFSAGGRAKRKKFRPGFDSGGLTTTTTSAPPAGVLANYNAVVNRATNVANAPLDQSVSPSVAGFTPAQLQAFNTVNNAQGSAQPYINAAAGFASAGTTPVTAAAFSPQAVQQYQSPYTQSVVDTTRANIEEGNAEQQQGLAGSAISKGAFGGDRAGVAAGELARQQKLAEDQTIAGLQNQGYSQALGEFNTQQQVGVGTQEAQNWLAENAASQMGALGNEAQNTALTGASAQLQTGALQQQLAQSQQNVPYEQFLQRQAYPFQTTNYLSNIVQGIGNASGGTSSTTAPAPSFAGQVAGLGVGALGLAGAANQAGAFNQGGFLSNLFAARGGRVPHRAGGGFVPGFAAGGAPRLPHSDIPDPSVDFIPDNAITTRGGGGGGANGIPKSSPAGQSDTSVGEALKAAAGLTGLLKKAPADAAQTFDPATVADFGGTPEAAAAQAAITGQSAGAGSFGGDVSGSLGGFGGDAASSAATDAASTAAVDSSGGVLSDIAGFFGFNRGGAVRRGFDAGGNVSPLITGFDPSPGRGIPIPRLGTAAGTDVLDINPVSSYSNPQPAPPPFAPPPLPVAPTPGSGGFGPTGPIATSPTADPQGGGGTSGGSSGSGPGDVGQAGRGSVDVGSINGPSGVGVGGLVGAGLGGLVGGALGPVGSIAGAIAGRALGKAAASALGFTDAATQAAQATAAEDAATAKDAANNPNAEGVTGSEQSGTEGGRNQGGGGPAGPGTGGVGGSGDPGPEGGRAEGAGGRGPGSEGGPGATGGGNSAGGPGEGAGSGGGGGPGGQGGNDSGGGSDGGHGLRRGGFIPRRSFDDGGSVGGYTPAPGGGFGGNPNAQNSYAQYANLPIEKLQEMAVRMPQNALIQRALQAKRINPGMQQQQGGQPAMQAMGPSAFAPTPGMMGAWRGGRAGFADGGDADVPDDALPVDPYHLPGERGFVPNPGYHEPVALPEYAGDDSTPTRAVARDEDEPVPQRAVPGMTLPKGFSLTSPAQAADWPPPSPVDQMTDSELIEASKDNRYPSHLVNEEMQKRGIKTGFGKTVEKVATGIGKVARRWGEAEQAAPGESQLESEGTPVVWPAVKASGIGTYRYLAEPESTPASMSERSRGDESLRMPATSERGYDRPRMTEDEFLSIPSSERRRDPVGILPSTRANPSQVGAMPDEEPQPAGPVPSVDDSGAGIRRGFSPTRRDDYDVPANVADVPRPTSKPPIPDEPWRPVPRVETGLPSQPTTSGATVTAAPPSVRPSTAVTSRGFTPVPSGTSDPSHPYLASDTETLEGSGPNAVSPKGARGTMQVMDATAANPGFGVVPARNSGADERNRVGVDLINALGRYYGGNEMLAHAAYNGGFANVDKWIQQFGDPSKGEISDADFAAKIPFAETRNYAQRSLALAASRSDGTRPAAGFAATGDGGAPIVEADDDRMREGTFGAGTNVTLQGDDSKPTPSPTERAQASGYNPMDFWMGLANAGFGMAASRNPQVLGAAGEGALHGIKYVGEQQKVRMEQQRLDTEQEWRKAEAESQRNRYATDTKRLDNQFQIQMDEHARQRSHDADMAQRWENQNRVAQQREDERRVEEKRREDETRWVYQGPGEENGVKGSYYYDPRSKSPEPVFRPVRTEPKGVTKAPMSDAQIELDAKRLAGQDAGRFLGTQAARDTYQKQREEYHRNGLRAQRDGATYSPGSGAPAAAEPKFTEGQEIVQNGYRFKVINGKPVNQGPVQ